MTGEVPAAALDYAERLGWPVFPVARDGRSPLILHGVHQATTDAGLIQAWWAARPSANVALQCGPTSGVLALDVDRKGEVDGFACMAELEAEFEPLPATVRSRTPSGGAHLLFRHPLGVTVANRVGVKRYGQDGTRRVLHGLDVRSTGASICLPPSEKEGGRYTWEIAPGDMPLAPLPRWLLALLISEPPPSARPLLPVRADSTERVARYVASAVDRECESLARMGPNTGRNSKLFQAAANLGEFVGANLLRRDHVEGWLERAASECGLVREDGLHAVRASIASGLKRGMAKPRELSA